VEEEKLAEVSKLTETSADVEAYWAIEEDPVRDL